MVTVAETEGIDNGRLVIHNESYGNHELFAVCVVYFYHRFYYY